MLLYMKTLKKPRELERIVKGFANHRRIEILVLMKNKTELSVGEIAEILKINIKTASEHIRRLATSGLVLKRYAGQSVRHKVSPRGNNILIFLRILE